MGYDYIALGGLVPRRNEEIAEVLDAVREETAGEVRLHLLGVVRPGLYDLMRDCGVVSFDSSSPVWQAFKDASDNYYSADEDGHYTAVRIPQANLGLPMRLVKAGKLDQANAVQAEREALEALRAYDANTLGLPALMDVLRVYDDMLGTQRKTRTPWDRIQRTLADRPWASCPCPVCRELGVEVILFRGANRNRRRGFHNLWWTQRQLEQWRGDQA
ncbi:MAG: hypothetical protein KC470_11285 [Dehalococcoidia bacterium]|nr:hypothetical protein [Dehalococcoidia bacterium]